jgi:very-short-patch-repair endonuclease
MTDDSTNYPAKAPRELWAKLKPLARQKRHVPTPAENQIWQHVRNRQINGAKFRRQHVIERFNVDFYCAEARLLVEVDGPIHEYIPEEDAVRQEFLEALGFLMLRFSNDMVFQQMDVVLAAIGAAVEERLPHPPTPSP